jgi:hypothetical protein
MSAIVNPNKAMQDMANFAVKAAGDRFGRILDFTEESFPQLDNLLELANGHIMQLKKSGRLAESTIQSTTL